MDSYLRSALSNIRPYLPATLLPNFVQNYIKETSLYRSDAARMTFFTLGAGYALWKFLDFTRIALNYLVIYNGNIDERYGKNSWAVVTGAADGMGRAFSFELARQGFNIVLADINEPKLKQTDSELRSKYPTVKTRTMIVDLSRACEEGFAENIYDQVKDLDVSILINNAGIYLADYYRNLKITQIKNLVVINSLSHALIIRAFLPHFRKRAKRSAIINTTSLAASFPKPFEQIYSASKTFHDFLSQGLSYEEPNIDIISFKPGPVSTGLNNYKKVNYNTILAEDAARACLSRVGRTYSTYGHIKHRFDFLTMKYMPRSLRVKYYKWRYNVKGDIENRK